MEHDAALRAHLVYLLRGGGAHLPLDTTLADWPDELRGVRPEGQPHTAWRLLEHVRIAQKDILDFATREDYAELAWPEGYWPADDAPPGGGAWDASVRTLSDDLEAMIALVENPATELFAPIPWGDGQTILREALLVADHNAYHQGQLVMLRRLLGLAPSA